MGVLQRITCLMAAQNILIEHHSGLPDAWCVWFKNSELIMQM